jgi:hypothetical protein
MRLMQLSLILLATLAFDHVHGDGQLRREIWRSAQASGWAFNARIERQVAALLPIDR